MDRVSKGETRTVDGPCGPWRSGVPIVSQPHPKPTHTNPSKSLWSDGTKRKTISHATKPSERPSRMRRNHDVPLGETNRNLRG